MAPGEEKASGEGQLTVRRLAAAGSVALAGVAIGYFLLTGGGPDYQVKARFQNASQIVKGNLVQVSGRPVGKVHEIALTSDGQAELTLRIDDDFAPLRQGTRAMVRASSLSGIANRYIDLHLPPATAPAIPDQGRIEASQTTTAVDLDQIFNVFGPRERRALSDVIRGSATQYAGRGAQANAGLLYLNPALGSSAALFRELTRDDALFERFITANSRLVTDVSQRASELSGLVDHLATTTGAIARQDDSLQDAIARLPAFMRRANTTFVNLRATLADLRPLVDESKPVARRLRPFLRELRPLAQDAQPTVRDLANLVRRAGADNDLIDLTRSNVPVRDIAIGPVNVNGALRAGAFPASARALGDSVTPLASARPYAPDLLGWFDDFSTSGPYDALGGLSRVALHVNLFTLLGNAPNLSPAGLINPGDRAANFSQIAQVHQNNRCPGAVERNNADGSNPFVEQTGCDPTQLPLGP
jgi:phospholipid/cholesterol/gamma-HCH transport system substrate-binding protein